MRRHFLSQFQRGNMKLIDTKQEDGPQILFVQHAGEQGTQNVCAKINEILHCHPNVNVDQSLILLNQYTYHLPAGP